jgi:polyisoprenoid-binding protein YceI
MRKTLLAFALFAFAGGALAAPVSYEIDPKHTMVLASWNHFGFSNPTINFGQAKGTIVYDAENVSASSVEVTLPIRGIDALAADFFDHLTSGNWFNAAEYPEATFRSTSVEAAGQDRLKVTGDLTVKGTTRPVVLDVVLNGTGPHPMTKRPSIGFDATATVLRSDFGLGNYAPAVSDEVTLRITTEASAAAAN